MKNKILSFLKKRPLSKNKNTFEDLKSTSLNDFFNTLNNTRPIHPIVEYKTKTPSKINKKDKPLSSGFSLPAQEQKFELFVKNKSSIGGSIPESNIEFNSVFDRNPLSLSIAPISTDENDNDFIAEFKYNELDHLFINFSENDKDERRSSNRYSNGNVRAKMLINSFISDPYYKHVTLFDWSTGGLSFCYEKKIRLGKTIKFNITVSDNVSFYMKAKVVHNSSMKVIKDQTFFQMGVKFTKHNESYIELIIKNHIVNNASLISSQ